MKLQFTLLISTVVLQSHASVLSKLTRASHAADISVKESRKLSLFVRTSAESSRAPHEGVSIQDMAGPSFGGQPNLQPPPLPRRASSTGFYEPQPLVTGNALYSSCHPVCHWTCGTATCDEDCKPVCAPPQCETACAPLSLNNCEQKCGSPTCHIICPVHQCSHGDCPGCKALCSPPICHTSCAEKCESKCSKPSCTWKCKPGKCERPRCRLQCGGPSSCGLSRNVDARPPPFDPGMKVMARGLAKVNASELAPFAPKPWEAKSGSGDEKPLR